MNPQNKLNTQLAFISYAAPSVAQQYITDVQFATKLVSKFLSVNCPSGYIHFFSILWCQFIEKVYFVHFGSLNLRFWRVFKAVLQGYRCGIISAFI